jgi:hypothetical protein
MLGLFERGVETLALGGGEERKEKTVGEFAFEHEVDAEKDGGEDIEDVSEPERERAEDVAGGGGEGSFGTLDDAVDAELVGHGDLLDAGDDLGDALGKVVGELAEIAEDGWKAGGEEDCQNHEDGEDEKNDRDGARGMVAANAVFGDAGDDRHQDDGEEGADVEDQQLFLEDPGEGEKEQDDDAEEDIAADRSSGLLLVGGQMWEYGRQLVLLWVMTV